MENKFSTGWIFSFRAPRIFLSASNHYCARGANCKNHFLVSERRGNFHNIKYYRVGEFGWRWMGWEWRGLPPEEKKASTEKKTHCISNPPCTFYNHCVYLLQERKYFWRRLQVKSLLFLPETLFSSCWLLPSPCDEKISSQRFPPPSASFFVILLTLVCAFYFTWRNTTRHKKNQLHKDKYPDHLRLPLQSNDKKMSCHSRVKTFFYSLPLFISSVPNENRVQVY